MVGVVCPSALCCAAPSRARIATVARARRGAAEGRAASVVAKGGRRPAAKTCAQSGAAYDE
eukprot:gene7987-516_t